ncbi:hypothetical protein CPC08DRAFT_715712 [Agrocybe pediades]|nr:hypothetical protein CPC08DRAFT_715712 [Agrocybe pediades]
MARIFNIASFVFFLVAGAAAVAMPEPGSGGLNAQCGSDTDCSHGLSCCKAIPYPKCVRLPTGAVC